MSCGLLRLGLRRSSDGKVGGFPERFDVSGADDFDAWAMDSCYDLWC